MSGPAESNCSRTLAITRGGRKWVCTSKSPGRPSPAANATGSTVTSGRLIRRAGASVGQALEPATHGLLILALRLTVGQRVPLVVGLLALGEPDLDLRAAVLEVQGQRDQRVALVADLALDLGDLGLVEQQLAATTGGMVGPRALRVLRDVDAVQPDLVAVDLGEAVHQGGAALSKGLHLGPHEHEAGLPRVLHVVVVSRLAVLRDHLAPLLLRHPAIVSGRCAGSESRGLDRRDRRAGCSAQPIQEAGFTATPLTMTVMWVWQPVDQPVVPIKPTTWPRDTAWPTWVR